jgi:hypothetical protein
MPVLFERIYKTPTPSGGKWQYSTETEFSGHRMNPRFIRQILTRSTTPTTTYDCLIYDEEGVQIRRFITATGIVNDLTPTPIRGHVTIAIDNASADEPFEVLMIFCDEG